MKIIAVDARISIGFIQLFRWDYWCCKLENDRIVSYEANKFCEVEGAIISTMK